MSIGATENSCLERPEDLSILVSLSRRPGRPCGRSRPQRMKAVMFLPSACGLRLAPLSPLTFDRASRRREPAAPAGQAIALLAHCLPSATRQSPFGVTLRPTPLRDTACRRAPRLPSHPRV